MANLIGSKPNQVSTNEMLGDCAFMGKKNFRTKTAHIETAQIGSSQDHVKIDESGNIQLMGNATVWEDMRFPAYSLNPVGSASDAVLDSSSTFMGTLLFADGATKVCCGQAQFPHQMRENSILKPHIHWSPTVSTPGSVLWRLEYQIAPVSGAFPGSYTVMDILAPAGATANAHLTKSFGDIFGAFGVGLSAMMVWKLSRVGADVSDTYGADARLLEFDIHYEIDSIGSKEEWAK